MPQIYDMGPTALLPFRRKACWGFFRPEKFWRLRPGLNPRTWVLKGSTLPLDRQSRLFFVALVSQHAKCTCHIIPSFAGCPVLPHFFTLSHKRRHFGTKFINIKHVFWFSPQLLSETALILRRTQWDPIIIGAHSGAVCWDTALQTGRSRVRFPMFSLKFFIDIILPAALWPWGWLSL